MNLDFSMITLDHVIEYFAAMFRTILAFFNVQMDDETASNIESMFDNLFGYEPEV